MKWFYILFIGFLACQGPQTRSTMNKVSLEGRAENAKGGAVLLIDNGEVYYIEKLSAWDDSMVGKRVVVEGLVKEVKLFADPINEKGEIQQGAEGTQHLITQATWKLK